MNELLTWLCPPVRRHHKWRFVEVGDPSIGGTMVSRFFTCEHCEKVIDTTEWLTSKYDEDVCNK